MQAWSIRYDIDKKNMILASHLQEATAKVSYLSKHATEDISSIYEND